MTKQLRVDLENTQRNYALDKKKVAQAHSDKETAKSSVIDNHEKLLKVLNENRDLMQVPPKPLGPSDPSP